MTTTTTTSSYTLRPIEPADMEFLCRLYMSTRTEELSVVPWTDEQKDAFLRQQFAAQHAHWQEHYKGSSFDVVLAGGVPAGRLYVARWAREIRLVDIALMPELRRHGLGAKLIGDVLEEGRRAAKPVSIHVERLNPALRLYERLGFKLREDKGIYLLMEWSPVTEPEEERA